MISFQTSYKLLSVRLLTSGMVSTCATLINYSYDLKGIKHLMTDAQLQLVYDSYMTLNRIGTATAGGVLCLITLVVLLFSIGQFINENSAELGVLKALGYCENRIAIEFSKFGLN